MTEWRTHAVAVDGGDLAVAETGPEDGPVLLAIHGITASSRSFAALVGALPEVRIVAPDLRGRARSNDLPGPYGLRRHAQDVRHVLHALRLDSVVALGHSMGGFVTLLAAADEQERIASVVLVDGGLPLTPPPGVDLDAIDPKALLGPAFERLTRVFPSRAEYEQFWIGHPAFAGQWSDDLAEYVDYDLDEVPGGFRPSAVPDAVAADQRELFGPEWYVEALHSVHQPVVVLRAPLGLQAQPPGLYPPGALEAARQELPQLRIVEVPGVNHYTIVMASPGVDEVAAAVRTALNN
ncbi:alpha/beta fold hydrolase [uncultured Amnibacterium sp.]|uniref:alpha/beta fold hydrolase n=1 Tax=uncultured Amnibacterium sp. TaxID=1631851 RepID=UPI0035CC13AE